MIETYVSPNPLSWVRVPPLGSRWRLRPGLTPEPNTGSPVLMGTVQRVFPDLVVALLGDCGVTTYIEAGAFPFWYEPAGLPGPVEPTTEESAP